jgi:hypothetical protein
MFEFLSRKSTSVLAEKDREIGALNARIDNLASENAALKRQVDVIRIKPECDRTSCDWLRASANQVEGITKMVEQVQQSSTQLHGLIRDEQRLFQEGAMATHCEGTSVESLITSVAEMGGDSKTISSDIASLGQQIYGSSRISVGKNA